MGEVDVGALAIRYGETDIGYTVVTRPGKTISITVYPDRSVAVRAPEQASAFAVKTHVLRRARWILRQQADLARFEPRPTPRQYVSGESYRYLGRQHLLRVVPGDVGGVRLARPRLEISVRGQISPVTVRRLLTKWYRERALAVFGERWQTCLAKIQRHGVPTAGFQLLSMKRRWGSCTASRKVLLNPELVKAPTECIDYVMLHELCHLRFPAHDWRFYRLLGRVCPDWPRLKSRLNRVEL